ncbi:hypothetical protein FH972_023105 [Carpinus fangiana]|uniref:NmrA-like domain-containing protein n=1 Tax=Carpinus fangiana TaxID=176857 RepID=A0A5N6KUP8_9ROSI|nr:hypothetical protein FH972_023105 [Carpinus fangiana]
MSSKQARNIAIVGGSGSVGTPTVAALLAHGIHTITAITRADSTATFAAGVKVVKGSYDDLSFLEASLNGQDALIIQLAFMADPSVQSNLISAAAKAGVPWIIPCEFGSDTGNPKFTDEVPIMQTKAEYRNQIEKLGVSSWIGIINNPWFDFSLRGGQFGINVAERKARLYGNGTVKANTTTLSKVGKSVAGLLSLPDAELEKFRNTWAYLSSFRVSQRDILESVIRATNTTEGDWAIEQVDPDQTSEDAKKRAATGDYGAIVDLVYGTTFRQGYGGDYEATKSVVNKLLGLESEDLDQTDRSNILGQPKPETYHSHKQCSMSSSVPLTQAFIHHGSWSDTTRAHPALAWFEGYTKDLIDAQKWDTPAAEHHDPDFWLQKPDGTVIKGADQAWAAVHELYQPFAAHFHDPTFLVLSDTSDGWTMAGQANVFGNLQGPLGETKATDSTGKAWELMTPAMFIFHFVKSSNKAGVALKSTRIFSDSGPAIVAMLKKGLIKPEQLLG